HPTRSILLGPKPPPPSPPPSAAPRLPWASRPYKRPTPHPFLPRSLSIHPSAVLASSSLLLDLTRSDPHFSAGTMAETKMVVVALLLVALVMASSTVPAADALCFTDCYGRCANGQVGNVACSNMCSQACVVPKTLPDGTDLASLFPGGK
ncbi:hypothetical protein BHE74_00041367, partial [Ensete ventricosum]